MKGGKRLSEDARERLVESIRKAIYDIETISPSIAIDLDIVARFLERDDEPREGGVMAYKTFSMDDTDAGRASIVVASDMIRALELFKRAHGTYPERVRDMTADGETVIIEGLQEIEMRF